MRFSSMPLFHHFYPKIDANAHFNAVFLNIGQFNRKKINTVRVFIIKIRISMSFTLLRSKLAPEICSKIGGLDEKTEQNRLKVPTLPHFF